jgi:hypothetical protein
VNKSGGPDLRFNDNRQIPIYRYGQIFMTRGDWHMNVCVSRADAASQFAAALRTASVVTPKPANGGHLKTGQ